MDILCRLRKMRSFSPNLSIRQSLSKNVTSSAVLVKRLTLFRLSGKMVTNSSPFDALFQTAQLKTKKEGKNNEHNAP